jgi:hypothetical protein
MADLDPCAALCDCGIRGCVTHRAVRRSWLRRLLRRR